MGPPSRWGQQRGLTHAVACGRAEGCSAPPWGASGGPGSPAWGTGSSLGPSRSPPGFESRIRSSWNTAGERQRLDSEGRSGTTAPDPPRVLTRPQSPTCHLTRVGQGAASQRWTACGRRRWAQDSWSSFTPLESTQVTSLVCSPEPQVTEHCRQSLTSTPRLHLQTCWLRNSPRSSQPRGTPDTCACCTSAKRAGPRHRRHKRRPQRRGGQRNRGRRTPPCAPGSPPRREQSRSSTHQFSSWETTRRGESEVVTTNQHVGVHHKDTTLIQLTC